MDYLVVLICIVPLQVLLFLTVFWCQSKFDKYEKVAIKLINKKQEIDCDIYQKYVNAALAYKNIIGEIDILPSREPEENILREYKRVVAALTTFRKTALLERSVRAIAHMLHDKTTETFEIASHIVGNIDENPLTSIVLDLLAVAWTGFKQEHLATRGGLYPRMS